MQTGLKKFLISPGHTYSLPTDETTLPQALQQAGYTTAMVGKWHLGPADEKYWPQNRGVDHDYGKLVGEVDYFTKERGDIIDWRRNGEFLKDDGYQTTLIGDEVVNLIAKQDNRKLFFLYFDCAGRHLSLQITSPIVRSF